MKLVSFLLILSGLATSLYAQEGISSSKNIVGTYSIVAWDSATGDLGVAVQSKFLGVGAVVPFARAGIGAIATQAFANTTFGPRGLEMLERGLTPRQVVEDLVESDTGASSRQFGVVDSRGNSFAHTGSSCPPYARHITGRGYSVQGNTLAGDAVLKAMARMFELTSGDLADRLLAAVDAGEAAGGDKRGRQSAALLVVRDRGGYGGFNDRFIDIRVDDDSLPLAELRRIYKLWKVTFLLDARLRTVDEFNRQKKYDAARIEMQRVIESFNEELRSRPDDPEMLNNIAWTLVTHDLDKEHALELAQRAAKLAPEKTYIFDTLAECHFRNGNYDEAIAIEAELVTKDPHNDAYWKQLQKFKEAKQHGVH